MYATNLLDMARIFGLLPFFVLGLRLDDREWGRAAHGVPSPGRWRASLSSWSSPW